ncbi:hypothetical protein HDU79_003651 [Rhizoclosmatium sp. JEL0117]|nr:hypothetical protein HDU79_003651 [Rhizoclosmatium sp. JEL0117]
MEGRARTAGVAMSPTPSQRSNRSGASGATGTGTGMPPVPVVRSRSKAGRAGVAPATTASSRGFDDMLRDLADFGGAPGAPGAPAAVSRSGSKASGRSNQTSGQGQASGSNANRTSDYAQLMRELDAVDVTANAPPLSVGQQIVQTERARREQDQRDRQRAADAAKALEAAAFERERVEQRREDERRRLLEEQKTKADGEKARRAKARRDGELRDSATRNAAIEAALSAGGLAFASAARLHTFNKDNTIVPEYVNALIRTLMADQTIAPLPEDFASYDGFALWERSINKPLQEVIADLLYARHIEQAVPSKIIPATIDIFFKVVEAHGLIAKEGRSRDAYCRIEFGQIPNPDIPPRTGIEIFMTETCSQTVNPAWNQHVDVATRDLSDVLIVSVWDRRKDDFLGRVVMTVKDVVLACGAAGTDGFVSRWAKLEKRGGKTNDKYVGGEILLEMSIDMERHPDPEDLQEADPISYLESTLVACKINFKAIYATLLRSCLILDINTNVPAATQPPPLDPNAPHEIIDLLSEESAATLRIWEEKWMIRHSYKVLAYLDLIFQKYMLYEVPVWALLNAYEELYGNMKRNEGWLNEHEKPFLIDTLEEMHSHYKTQVSNYKEYYPKNKPDEALESTILLLRMIFKSPVFREVHPELPKSFRTEIKEIMIDASNNRFKKLQALASPLDETDVEEVVGGLARLAELLVEDLINDFKYFKKPFEIELDIVKLNAEIFFSRFVGVLSAQFDTLLANEKVVEVASGNMFLLLKGLRSFDSKYCRIYPGIKKSIAYQNFTVEDWILPFISKWLDHLGTLTVEWVTNAVKIDNFEVMVSEGGMGSSGEESFSHSSSIMDLFQAVYKELDSIMDLKWSNEVQNAGFIQKFAKTVSRAIENYCDVVGTDEVGENKGQFSNFISSLRQQKKDKAPADITQESCVKLCNLEFALVKLDEMHKTLNVTTLTRAQTDHRRRTLALTPNPTVTASSALDDQNKIKGAFKIELVYAENVKPVTKSGVANPYMVIRLPDGTVVPTTDDDALPATTGMFGGKGKKKDGPVTLTGKECELGRTRPINETINPVWDETFSSLLPPVSHLDVFIYSKNLISDELCGKSVIDLSGRLSRLRAKLADHHTHDVYIEFEPQGRGLVRMTLEGEQEDVDYWFRKSRERLKRTQNDLVRALTAKISPHLKEAIVKAVREQESVAVKQGFFNSTVQYTNQTAAGIAIDQLVNEGEAYMALDPLTEYLNKNLGTLCGSLSPSMAHEVIKRLWDEVLSDIEYVLIPPLYGQLETTRRFLNKRQVSLCGWALKILRDFFHADGEDLGLPFRVLDNRKFLDVNSLMTAYFNEITKLKREYELSVVSGREKEMLLRLVRVRIEKQEDFTAAEREDGRKWVEVQLAKRRDR